MKNRCLTEDNNIKSKANKKKMSKKSYNMVIERINKKMNNIIKKHSVDSKVSIVNIIQCLCDLKIINELIKSNQIIDLNIETIKDNIANINEKDQKKIKELELIEQLWFLINPTMEECINNQLFFELLKILFSSIDNNINNNQIKELTKYIANLLDKNNINYKDEDEDKNNSELSMISPLRDKKFSKNSLWPISKIIKTFLHLKSNIKAYRSNEYEYKKEELSNNLKEEREKELKFEPDLSQSNNYMFKKNSKYNYYIDEYKQLLNDDIYFYSYNYKKPKLDFNKIYERFMLQKKMHEKALEKLREIKRKKELKKCSNKPKISEYSPEQLNWSVDYENSKIYKRNNDIPIFERLYNNDTISFSYKATKDNNNKYECSPKLSPDRKLIVTDIKNAGDKNHGKKYEKEGINPFHIDNDSNEDKNNIKINKNKENNINNNNIIDNLPVIIVIKLPNGEIKSMKIYEKMNKTTEILNEFCRKNDINEEDKKIILGKIMDYKNSAFESNVIEENNDPNSNDDFNTISYTNNSIEGKEINKKYDNKNVEKMINNNEINIQDKKLKNLEDYITYKNEDILNKYE